MHCTFKYLTRCAPWSPQKINPMLSSVKSLTKLLQRLFAILISFGILFQVLTQPALALNDGQLLVIEAWNLVNIKGTYNYNEFLADTIPFDFGDAVAEVKRSR